MEDVKEIAQFVVALPQCPFRASDLPTTELLLLRGACGNKASTCDWLRAWLADQNPKEIFSLSESQFCVAALQKKECEETRMY